MNNLSENLFNKTTQYTTLFRGGILLNVLLVILFIINTYTDAPHKGGGDFFESSFLFFTGFVCTAVYLVSIFIALIYNRKNDNKQHFFELWAFFINAFTISAYLLNSAIPIFSTFATWAMVIIGMIHLTLIFFAVAHKLPKQVLPFIAPFIGISFAFVIYLTIYLAPTYPIGVIGTIFFGMSLHLFAPLFIFIAYIYFIVKYVSKNTLANRLMWAGFCLPFIFTVYFLFQWNNSSSIIHKANASIITEPDNKLPNWVKISQQWPSGWIAQKMLEGPLVYDKPMAFDFLDSGMNSFDEDKKHDPLVLIATALFEDINISKEDRIKVLESQFDARHQAHRKLWSGQDLNTKEVLTNIKVYPDYRIAYTEKIITIKHQQNRNSWPRQQEALYTFYLPEGSVATSLSLWIEGVEEKSRLTTKGKADSAYVQIVGREARDPALLHWQEGNRVTVTVFPCTVEEDRKFRIGFTIPLEEKKDKLVLKNIYFDGPEVHRALETTVIEIDGNGSYKNSLPSNYKTIGQNRFEHTGTYNPYWEIEFPKTDIKTNRFEFLGNQYSMSEYEPKLSEFDAEEIYLDLNAEWNTSEIKTVFELFKGKSIYVYSNKLIQLSEYDADLIENVFLEKRFSLFPLNAIKDIDKALLISKSPENAPNLGDLKTSNFSDKLKSFLDTNTVRINHFNLDNNWSPYLKTLNEFKILNSQTGSIEVLAKLIQENQFSERKLDENSIILGQSGVTITKDTSSTVSNTGAPDHLMRLFNYNQILQKIGKDYFNSDSYSSGELIELANAAYVSSPISSMVVLETIKDYERFDIDENKNSLANASANSSGSVPEPHEWLLIICTVLLLLFVKYKDQINTKWA